MLADKATATRRHFAALVVMVAIIAAACGGGTEITAGVAPTGDPDDTASGDPGGAAEDGTDGAAEDGTDGAAEDGTDSEGAGDGTDSEGAGASEERSTGDQRPADEPLDGGETSEPDDADGETSEPVEPDAVALRNVPGVIELEEELPEASVECVIAGLVKDRALALAVIRADSADLLDLEPAQAAAVIDLTLACIDDETLAELIRAGFEEEGFPLPVEVSSCFAGEFDTLENRRALLEMGLTSDGEPPDEVRDLLIDTMIACVPSDVWIEAIGDDLVPGGADDGVDLECVDELFADESFLRPFLTAAIEGDLADAPTPATVDLFTQVIGCVSFGTAVAAEAAADGFELSQPTIDCLDAAFAQPDVIEMLLVDDTMSDDFLGEMVFGCLSDDELADLLGS